MLHIKSLDEGLPIFKALGSEIRVEIIKILLENHGMSMNELASRLNITNGALTNHIKKLEDSGIVSISTLSSGHGNIKNALCFWTRSWWISTRGRILTISPVRCRKKNYIIQYNTKTTG